MATSGRERMEDVSEFLLLVGERLAEAAYRIRVEAVKATRLGRIRMEMVMLRRDRRAAIQRLGEAALTAVQEGRVSDPVLVSRAREVEDIGAAIEAKGDEASRLADLPDDAILDRPPARPAGGSSGGSGMAAGTGPVTGPGTTAGAGPFARPGTMADDGVATSHGAPPAAAASGGTGPATGPTGDDDPQGPTGARTSPPPGAA